MMKRLVFLALAVVFMAPPAHAQLFRRLFGGGQRLQAVSCVQQPAYQQTYYQQPYYQQNVQVVAAVPLATIPVAVDLQAYMYATNAGAFQSFREYQANKSQPTEQLVASQATTPAALPAPADDAGSGVAILSRNCMACHQAGRNPKAGFAMFDQQGKLADNLPFGGMLERISSPDPETRMPPKRTLSPHDAMAVFRLASSSIEVKPRRDPEEQIAANNKPQTPFD